ncbi:hypothetical protein, partial [Flavisericum labens]|uniref:hypothetical protein n=1 Tax=Flavisericum labens TaxID=3377112 RepID=UPI00387A96CF
MKKNYIYMFLCVLGTLLLSSTLLANNIYLDRNPVSSNYYSPYYGLISDYVKVFGVGNAYNLKAEFISSNVLIVIDNPASDLTVECDGSGNASELNNWLSSNGGATHSSGCAGIVTWSNDYDPITNPVNDDCGTTGSVTVTFTATDTCGDPFSANTTATFTIQDTTDPSIDTAASDQTVECDGAGNGTALTAWLNSNGGAAALDTCSNVTWSNNFTALSDLCGGTGSA